jgi:hypothetical protein
MELCLKQIGSRSKYVKVATRHCQLPKGHSGSCDEFPYLKHLQTVASKVANKVKRDSTMTTGAAWKSTDAGPNRILRWVMLLNDEELMSYGLNMQGLKPQVVAKLREKAATYDDCVNVAKKLTWYVYQMPLAPRPPNDIKEYLESHFGEMQAGSTVCGVCRLPLSFELFEQAKRGSAPIETCHLDPRIHNAVNVRFAHRECNIAQGDKSLEEFYSWIKGILSRAGKL